MEPILSACGLTCTLCPAYQATQANDPVAIEKVAEQWRAMHDPNIRAEHVWCDGCMTAGPRKCGHAGDCQIRACVVAKGLENCAGCTEYPCGMLEGFFQMVPYARETLEGVRKLGG